jgi:hypothetical protein
LGAVANASIYGRVQTIFPIARGLADAGAGAQRQEVVCRTSVASAGRRAIAETTFRRRRARRQELGDRPWARRRNWRRPGGRGPKISALTIRYFRVAAIQGTL